MKLTLMALLTVLVLVTMTMVHGKRIELYRDANVVVGEIHRPFTDFVAHMSATRFLTIHGRTHNGLRGQNPYFLDLSELGSILFVTEHPHGVVNFWIASVNSNEELRIDGHGSGFGWALTADRKPSTHYADYVEDVTSKRVTLATCSGSWKETMILNLANKSLERRDTFYYDSAGQITNHTIQTDFR